MRQSTPTLTLTQLPDEIILSIGSALLLADDSLENPRHPRLADVVAAARTCRTLHRILLDLAYCAAIRADAAQILRALPPPVLSLTAVVSAPPPVALWAAERGRVDTLARLWDADVALSQSRSQSQSGSGNGSRSRSQGQGQGQNRNRSGQMAAGAAPDSNSSSASTSNAAAGAEPVELETETTATSTATYLTSAFWYPMPPACQHDMAHARWRQRPWHETIATPLLEAGWCTALHLAAAGGHLTAMHMLLAQGAIVDATARHVCVCASGHMRHVLSGEGLGIDDPDDAPVATPLHVALANGRLEAAQLLVEAGADWAGEVVLQPALYVEVDVDVDQHVGGGGGGDDDGEAGHSRKLVRLLYDDPHDHAAINARISRSRKGGPNTTNTNSNEEHEDALGLPRKTLCNRLGQHRPARLCSDLGMSLGATGLRIAAANAALPFLAWLARTGRTLPVLTADTDDIDIDMDDDDDADAAGEGEGELFEADASGDVDFGALHFAAHAAAAATGVEIGHGPADRRVEDDDGGISVQATTHAGNDVGDGSVIQKERKSRREGENDNETDCAKAALASSAAEDLVAHLLRVGVRWPDDADERLELVRYVGRWNKALARILERGPLREDPY